VLVAGGVTVVFLEIVSVVVGLSTPFGAAVPELFCSVAVKESGFPAGSVTSRGMYCTAVPLSPPVTAISGMMEYAPALEPEPP
jgi:hypothetical protein